MQHVLSELQRLRRRTRWMLIILHVAVLLAWLVGGFLALVLLDFTFRLPGGLRLLLSLGAVVGLGAAIVRYLGPSLAYRPSLVDLALRIERSMPTLAGRLASSVEFAASGTDARNPLAARAVRDTESRLAGEALGSMVRPGRLLRDLSIFSGLAVIAASLLLVNPAAARTGILRYVAPLGTAAWPARTAVESLMHEVVSGDVHPRGTVLPLRARNLTRGGADERVTVSYRLRGEEGWRPWRREVLTHQGAGVHERLLDTTGRDTIELLFETEDARTAPETIRILPAPGVVAATLEITPPAYAAGRAEPLRADLGPGLDDRARTERPSLIGSAVLLTLQFNKPLEAPATDAELRETLSWSADPLPACTADGVTWTLAWTLAESAALRLDLRDEHGLTNSEPILYAIDAMADLPPSVTITDPEADLAVLPGALVDLAAEASDDVAVRTLGLDAAVVRADARQPFQVGTPEAPDARTASLATVVDLGPQELREGDVVEVFAVAEDGFDLDGRQHEPVRSTVRRLRVISEIDFAAQLRRQLSAVRQNAIRIEATQAELQDDVVRTGAQPGHDRAQAQLAERIASQRETISAIERRLDRNRLEDPGLRELLTQSRDLLDYAGRSANAAAERIAERRQRIESGEEEAAERDDSRTEPRAEDRAITDAQQSSREELSDLIELLDRDEDTWVVQKRLAALVEAQQGLLERTGRLARETIGRELADLDEGTREEIDDVARDEDELVDEARRLIEEMRRRAAALEPVDPNAASGMRTAADTAEEREVDRDMEQAAEQARQNRMQSSAAAQQAALDTLQRMMEDIEATKQARAEELLRRLASLIESIDRLIAVQENELIALAQSVEADSFTGRDRAMIRLNQNTQAVAVEARAAGQASRRIARTLDRGADAQGSAIGALRARPIDAAEARTAEERSLVLLKEARELADELQQETQEDQVREEREKLIAAYRALAEREVALRESTRELAGQPELNRRQLVEARRLGNDQQTIREELSALEKSTQELMDSEIFSFVHGLLDDWCGMVSDALWDGTVDIDVTDREQMIAEAIGRQVEAIEEAARQAEAFADNQQPQEGQQGGGAQSGGAQPLIPPVAELKRLHGLQEQVYMETKRLEERSDLDDARRSVRVRELAELQEALIRLGEGIVEQMTGGGTPAPAPAERQPG